MRTCRLCKSDTELDDVVLSLPSGRCVCLRCYGRETDSAPVMPAALRRALRAALAVAATAPTGQASAETTPAPDTRPAAPAPGTDAEWQPRWWDPFEGSL